MHSHTEWITGKLRDSRQVFKTTLFRGLFSMILIWRWSSYHCFIVKYFVPNSRTYQRLWYLKKISRPLSHPNLPSQSWSQSSFTLSALWNANRGKRQKMMAQRKTMHWQRPNANYSKSKKRETRNTKGERKLTFASLSFPCSFALRHSLLLHHSFSFFSNLPRAAHQSPRISFFAFIITSTRSPQQRTKKNKQKTSQNPLTSNSLYSACWERYVFWEAWRYRLRCSITNKTCHWRH